MPEAIRITSPVLSRETTEKVLQILRAEVGDKVRLENPTQNLESYFLGVVERARAGAQTSGATSGNQVAAFIRGGAEAGTGQSDSVLDRLTKATAAPAVAVAAAPVPGAKVDNSKLAALTKHEEPAPPAKPAPPAAETPKPADLSQANEKLSGLLGGKK